MHAGAEKLIYQRAKELRTRATHTEELLWEYLSRKPLGYKFRRQHPFSIYILDFYCHALKLVIEIDGSIHNRQDIKDKDETRQNVLEREGLTVVRFTNAEVMNEIESTIFKLEALLRIKQRGPS